jgi:hypothetical protein
MPPSPSCAGVAVPPVTWLWVAVTAHDGTLTLHPNPDGGLTVHLDLPRAR